MGPPSASKLGSPSGFPNPTAASADWKGKELSMGMEMKLQFKLSQQLVMTPQLVQAIRLLQLSRLELVEEIRKELDGNPLLADDGGDSSSTSTRESSATQSREAQGLGDRLN